MNLKKLVPSLTLALLASGPLAAFAESPLESDPGYLEIDKVIDLKIVSPEVNVNLPRFLLKDAASSLNGGPDDPFKGTGINFADLVKDIKLIRVVVIDAGKDKKEALEKGVKALRAELETKWTPIVTVPEENVGIYVRGRADGESMAGLALLIYDDGDAVIANVVGQVPIGKVIQIASRMDKLPKDLLKKLAGAAPETAEKSGKRTETEPAK